MNNTPDYIEVEKTYFRDMIMVIRTDIIIATIMSILNALFFGVIWAGLIIFLVVGVVLPGIQTLWVLSHSAYRFDFIDGCILIYFNSFKRTIIKQIPYKNAVFVKMDWHQKNNPSYDVRYFDKCKPNHYSILPALSHINHWDKNSLDVLLQFADKYDIPINKWDAPF